MSLKQACATYIEAKKERTNCMQRQFKQLCQRCGFYNNCTVYSDYVSAWIELQKASKKEAS